MKQFVINNERYFARETISLYQILFYFNFSQELLVVEYNCKVIPEKNWKHISIENGDKLEIVTIVGGG